MTKIVFVLLVLCGVMTISVVDAAAQTSAGAGKWTISVNAGGQLQEHPTTTANSVPVFDEIAPFRATTTIPRGLLIDGGVRYPLRGPWSIGGGVSFFHASSDAAVTADIPDPFVFGKPPKTTNTTATDLSHTEIGYHVSVAWTHSLSPKFDVSLFAGPSFVRVSADVIPSITADFNQVATPLIAHQSATGIGYNAGVDFTYRINSRYGVGLLIRQVGAKADLESVSNQKLAGAQAAAGIRVRF